MVFCDDPERQDWGVGWEEVQKGSDGLPGWLRGKETSCQWRRHRRPRFDAWVRKTSWRRKWQPAPVFLPGESLGRGAWWATVRESQRIGHDWAGKGLHMYTQVDSLHCTAELNTTLWCNYTPPRETASKAVSQGFRFWKSLPEPQKPSWQRRCSAGPYDPPDLCLVPSLSASGPSLSQVTSTRGLPHIQDWCSWPPAHLTLNPQGQTWVLPFSASNLPIPRVPLPSWSSLACRICLAFHSGSDYHPTCRGQGSYLHLGSRNGPLSILKSLKT